MQAYKWKLNIRQQLGQDVGTMSAAQEFHQLLLRYLKEKTTLTPYRLQQLSGVTSARFANWKAGRRPPSDTDLQLLANVPELGLSFEDLFQMRALAKYGKSLSVICRNDNDIIIEAPEPVEGLYKVPLLGTVSAGGLTMADRPDEVSEFIAFYDLKSVSKDLFALRVVGDSMAPKIPDGAILLCRRAATIRNKGVYVVETEDGETTVKLLQYEGTTPQLAPVNPEHDTISLTNLKIRRVFQVLEFKVDLEGRLL